MLCSAVMILKQLRLKEIAYFGLTESDKTFKLRKPGLYSVSLDNFTSDYKLGNLQAYLEEPFGVKNSLKENKIRLSHIRNRTVATEQWNFLAKDNGDYTLHLPNLQEYLQDNPKLISRKIFNQKEIETIKLKISIRQSVSLTYRVLSMMIMGFSLFSLIIAIFFVINN